MRIDSVSSEFPSKCCLIYGLYNNIVGVRRRQNSIHNMYFPRYAVHVWNMHAVARLLWETYRIDAVPTGCLMYVSCRVVYIYVYSVLMSFLGEMIRKQKYSFPMRRDHANGPDRRYTAATMTTRFHVPDKRSAKYSAAHRMATMNAQSTHTNSVLSLAQQSVAPSSTSLSIAPSGKK